MICPCCFGKSYPKEVLTADDTFYDECKENSWGVKILCEECQGRGVVHCCEGLTCNE